MKIKRVLMVAVVCVFVAGVVNVNAAALRDSVAQTPWTVNVIDEDKPGVINLSSAFVGNNEVPMMSWGELGADYIYRSHLTPDGNGNCGPDNAWECLSALAPSLVDGTISNLATEVFINSHILRWVFQSGTKLRGVSIEQDDNLDYLTSSNEDLVDLSKFGGVLVGAPSLISDGLRYQMAFTVREPGGGDFPLYQLVYLHYSGTLNDTCLDNSRYECDVIEQVYGPNAIGAPSFQQALDDNLGMAYYKSGTLRYAYPWTTMPFRPSNCGPGGDSWRCIDIVKPGVGPLGTKVALGFGSSRTAAGIVFTQKPTTEYDLMRAIYVGSGGDCGADGITPSLTLQYRWVCSVEVASVEDSNLTAFSIAFDPDDYPVIAYNNQFDGDAAQKLFVAYSDARIGGGSGWHHYVVDGNDYSTTGLLNDLAINQSGLGFIGYMQPKFKACGEIFCFPDTTPNLKAALQLPVKYIYLPLIVK